MLSLEALLETDNVNRAKELIKEVITEARTIKKTDEQDKGRVTDD
jgi:hypothetical protein